MGNSNTNSNRNQKSNDKGKQETGDKDDTMSNHQDNGTRSVYSPKTPSVVSKKHKVDDFHHHGNIPGKHSRYTDLHPIFKYSRYPGHDGTGLFRIKTAASVSDTVKNKQPSRLRRDDDTNGTILTEEDIYNRARNADKKLNASYEDLISYLMEGTELMERPEITKARALLIWLSEQNVIIPRSGSGNYDTPAKGLIRLSNHNQTEYSFFYSLLCEKAGIESVEIQGIYKPMSYEPGKEAVLPKTSWNALRISQKWFLVFPYFVCTERKHVWLQKYEPTDKANNLIFNELYFMTDPKISMYWFHRDEPKWQLLQQAITQEEFLALPSFKTEFYELGLALHSENSYILRSQNGWVRIDITSPTDIADDIYLWYDLTLISKIEKNNAEIQKLTEHSNLQKLVTMIKRNEKWLFQITLPLEGTYKISIYGSVDGEEFGTIARFQLECNQKFDKCSILPSDPKEVGFGPGKAALDAGMVFSSHVNGFYPVKANKVFRIAFMLDVDVVDTIKVTGNLAQTEETGVKEYDENVKCTVDVDRGELLMDTHIPGNGVYMLTLWWQSNENSNQKNKKTVTTKLACSYLLISNPKVPTTVESRKQMEARENLRLARKSDKIDGIESAVAMCLHVHIPREDEEVQFAYKRVEILTLIRDIGFTLQNQNIQNVKQILHRIEKNDKFAYYFRNEVEELQKVKTALTWKKLNA